MNIPMYTPCRDYLAHKVEYDQAIANVLTSGAFINGPQVSQLEKDLATFIGSKYCLGMASGTDALLVALMALGVGPGDEVITVAHTWISSSEVISLLGGVPVFIDIDPETFVMNLDLIEKNITKKTKGIMPVSLYGNMVDVQKLQTIAAKHNLWIIEDGAQSFGSVLNGIKSCSGWSTVGCTSFFPSKSMGAYGDAGACFTDDEGLANKMKAIRNHGGMERFKHNYIGINGRLDTIQAAILQVKLKYFPDVLVRRQEIAKYYSHKLNAAKVKGLVTPKVIPGLKSAWAQYSLLVLDRDRDAIVDSLKQKGVNVSIFYPKGLHQQPCFAYLGEFSLPQTDFVCKQVLNIPLFAELTLAELDYIVETLIAVINAYDLHNHNRDS